MNEANLPGIESTTVSTAVIDGKETTIPSGMEMHEGCLVCSVCKREECDCELRKEALKDMAERKAKKRARHQKRPRVYHKPDVEKQDLDTGPLTLIDEAKIGIWFVQKIGNVQRARKVFNAACALIKAAGE
jgi:hypothetical protein